jgi:hypothetical protein
VWTIGTGDQSLREGGGLFIASAAAGSIDATSPDVESASLGVLVIFLLRIVSLPERRASCFLHPGQGG